MAGASDAADAMTQRTMPPGKYVRRLTRAVLLLWLAVGFFSTALRDPATASDHNRVVAVGVVIGALFGLLGLLQAGKIVRVYRLRRAGGSASDAQAPVAWPRWPAPAPATGDPIDWAATGYPVAPAVHPQTGTVRPPTAAQNFTYNTQGSAAQNAARNANGSGS